MTTARLLLTGWSWNPMAALVAAAAGAYLLAFRGRGRPVLFLAGCALAALALVSPLALLASRYLFSAHMAQHLILLLVAPVLLVLGLPAGCRLPAAARGLLRAPVAWTAGVGSMWFWHVPALCDAAAASAGVHAVQSASLLLLGAAFWWPIAAPDPRDRIGPLGGIGYLFSACLACTALGIIITLTPAEVCPIFRSPADPVGILALARRRWALGPERDRQLGGLLMWVPMCLVYLSAIFVELARWYGEAAERAPSAPPGEAA
ncbi:MAG TPA: cytochrome c oxidase assembly protein [Opitutaceae bacterium]|nr:cytochrome c oxidase assembly protein [Opitutaceae bacterium]